MTMMRRDAVYFLPSFLPVFSVRCSYFRTAADGGKSNDWLGSHSHYSSCMSNYSSNVLPSELTMLQISALWVFTYRNRHWLRGARAWSLVLALKPRTVVIIARERLLSPCCRNVRQNMCQVNSADVDISSSSPTASPHRCMNNHRQRATREPSGILRR